MFLWLVSTDSPLGINTECVFGSYLAVDRGFYGRCDLRDLRPQGAGRRRSTGPS